MVVAKTMTFSFEFDIQSNWFNIIIHYPVSVFKVTYTASAPPHSSIPFGVDFVVVTRSAIQIARLPDSISLIRCRYLNSRRRRGGTTPGPL